MEALIDQGVLSEPKARQHPQRSVVLEALDGIERPLAPARRFHARADDRLLLCSDGVSDYVSDAEISEVLRNADAGVAARELVDLAFDHGSRDNITAVIAATDPRDAWLRSLPAAGKSD